MACPGVFPRHYPLQTLHSLSLRAPPVFARPHQSQSVLHPVAKVRLGPLSTRLCLAVSLCCEKVFLSCLMQFQPCAWHLYITLHVARVKEYCAHACTCMCICTCICMYVKALVAIPLVLSILFLIQGLSLVWSLQSLAGWWVAGSCLTSAPQHRVYKSTMHSFSFSMGSRGSGPCACVASLLLTEPSPQP